MVLEYRQNVCPRTLQGMILQEVQAVQVALAGHHSLCLADQVVPEGLVDQ